MVAIKYIYIKRKEREIVLMFYNKKKTNLSQDKLNKGSSNLFMVAIKYKKRKKEKEKKRDCFNVL